MDIESPTLQVNGAGAERTLILDGSDSWTIGRSAENLFVFEDDAMSRRHAMVQQIQPGKFHLIDLGSSNGSSVNGQRISKSVELHDGDTIVCGNTTLIFHQPVRETQPTETPSGPTVMLYQKRLITVLVVDVRRFTQMAREIDEELLAQTMGTWFRELGSVFSRNGSVSDKYIGDAAMSVWVHENQLPDQQQIRRVLQTLLKIHRLATSLKDRFALPSPVCIGAGINTGVSVISNTGSQGNPDFSPLGDSVNAAFRLESLTKEIGADVALGRLTFECLVGVYDVQPYFEKQITELRGYQQPVEVWLTSYAKLAEFLSSTEEPNKDPSVSA